MEIIGRILSIYFHSEKTGYTVMRVYAEEEDEEFSAVGTTMGLTEGMLVELVGEWGVHPKYGEQFQCTSVHPHTPTTKEEIYHYLSSGTLPHIRRRMAKRILDAFGEEALDILQHDPKQYLSIEGIGEKKLEEIRKAFEESWGLRRFIATASRLGLSTAMAQKIYDAFPGEALDVLERTPYRLVLEVSGLGFSRVDAMAKELGIGENDLMRKEAALHEVMNRAVGEGHCYLPFDLATERVQKLLKEKDLTLDAMEIGMHRRYYLVQGKDELRIYMANLLKDENTVAKELAARLDNVQVLGKLIDVDKVATSLGISLAARQKEALHLGLSSGVMILTGGPGTGKTTTLRALITCFEAQGKKVVLAAPTGRAAKRMSEATHREASTIHRLIELGHEEEEAEKTIDGDVLVIDEVSMVDISLLARTLEALPDGCQLILVGDKDQLPSVGPGNVLRDLIASEKIPVVELDEIFRQAKDSQIVLGAHAVNEGEKPKVNIPGGDLFLVRHEARGLDELILSLVEKRLPDYYHVDPWEEIQVLTPMRKGEVGVNSLNTLLQERLNPLTEEMTEVELYGVRFREGDKIMHVKNNYQLTYRYGRESSALEGSGVFNGDMGKILEIDEEKREVLILFDDQRYATYPYQTMEEVRLAYAVTIHKSQGSEYPVVVIPLAPAPPMLQSRNLLYTAMTRAQKLVVLVGEEKYLERMVKNDHIGVRYSSLEEKLREVRG